LENSLILEAGGEEFEMFFDQFRDRLSIADELDEIDDLTEVESFSYLMSFLVAAVLLEDIQVKFASMSHQGFRRKFFEISPATAQSFDHCV